VLLAMKHQRRTIATGVIMMLLTAFLRVLEPWPIKIVIDLVTASAIERSNISIGPIHGPVAILLAAAFGILVVTGLRAMAGYVSVVKFAAAGNQIVAQLRGRLFSLMQYLPLEYHHNARKGDLILRLIGDVGRIRDATTTALMPLVTNIVIFLGMVAVMFWLNAMLTAVLLGLLPILWVYTASRTRAIHSTAKVKRAREGQLSATATETFMAIQTVQAMDLGDHFSSRFGHQNVGDLEMSAKSARLSAGLERTVDFLVAIMVALLLALGGNEVLAGRLTPGELVVFIFYMRRAFKPLRDFAKYSARLAKASAAVARVAELFDAAADDPGECQLADAPQLMGDIRFDNVSFRYADGRAALDRVSLHFRPGERIAIIGPSGAGKSTLVNLLLRLYEPTSGDIRVDGHVIGDVNIASLRRQIGVVLQDAQLFRGTVAENIAVACPDATPEKIERAAIFAGAATFIEQLPDGYNTMLDETGVNLSRGQRQRISIARTALRPSAIFLLDEPTGGLDAKTARELARTLRELTQGHTTIYISHRFDDLIDIDRIIRMDHGRVIEEINTSADQVVRELRAGAAT